MSYETTTLPVIGQVLGPDNYVRLEIAPIERRTLGTRIVDALHRNQRRILAAGTAAALAISLVGCDKPNPKIPKTTTTTSAVPSPRLRAGQRWEKTIEQLMNSAEPTGYTEVNDGQTGVAFYCFEESEEFVAKSGWSPNRLAQIGLRDTLIAVPGVEPRADGEVAYQPYQFAPGELEKVATRLQGAAAAINGSNTLHAGDKVATFRQCYANSYVLGTGQ